MSVVTDPRWQALSAGELACSCGERHVGLFPIQMLTPAGWAGSREYQPDDAMTMEGDFLSANFSVREGKYFAVRMRLPVPLLGLPAQALTYTVWTALDRPDFEAYFEAVRTNSQKLNARAPARLINRIGGYPDTFGLMGAGFQQTDGGGPYLLLDPKQPDRRDNHPLAIEQRQGVSLDRILELYAAQNHDMRSGRPNA
jgi:hypothetical protein